MQRVGPFRLEYVLGRGGMGKVYRAVHETMGHAVALKAVDPSRVDLSSGRAVLGAEVRSMARLDHPAIARVFAHGLCGPDDDLPDGTPWYATEVLSSDLLRSTRAMGWDALAELLDRLLDGLAHAHARGVIHRDLKASNVLFGLPSDDRPGPKLVDFGIAASGRDSLRRAGSPSTMAPEQGRRDLARIGPWTDLYAFGGLVWRLLTGRRPFGDATGPDLLIRKTKGRLDPFEPRVPCPDHVEGWLRTCLAPEPGERFPSAAMARAALRGRGGERVLRVRPTAPEPLPRGLAALGVSLLAVREPVLGGRHDERGRLWQAFLDAAQAGRSASLCLTGAEGVGASALGRGWVEHVHTHADAFAVGVQGRMGRTADEGVQELVDALLQPLGPPRDLTGRRRALQRVGLPADDERLERLDDAPPLPAAVEAAASLLETLASVRPLALFLDDTHLDAGLGLLAARLRRVEAPMMVLTREPTAPPGVEEVPVAPLRPAELSDVLARILPLTPAVHAAVVDASFGSPAALRRHLLQLRAGLVPTTQGFDHPLPLPEPAVEAAFLDALDPRDRRDLVQGAVVGAEVPLVVWTRATGRSTAEAQALLDRLEGWGWLPPRSRGLALPADLASALCARARARGELADLALRGARALHDLHGDPLAEGRCWREGGRPGEAVRAWLDHWRRMVFRHGPRVVLGTLMEAEQLLRDVPPVETLHGRRDRTELRLRFFLRDPELIARSRRALERAEAQGWHDTAMFASRSMAFAHELAPEQASAVYEATHATWFERCSPRFQAELLLGWYHHAERFADPRRDSLHERVVALLEASSDPRLRGQLDEVHTHRRLRDHDPTAIDSARRAVAHAQQHSPLQICQRWWLLGTAYQQQGRTSEAEQACREMASAALWLGQPQAHAWALANLAGLAAATGRWEVAARRAERARASCDLPYINAVMQLICAVPLAERGRWGEVRALWPDVEQHVPAILPYDPEVTAALERLLALATRDAHTLADRIRDLQERADGPRRVTPQPRDAS